MVESPESGIDITPEMRVSIALRLRGVLSEWTEEDSSRHAVSTQMWNDLQVCDVPEEDPDSDKAFKRVRREMLDRGILTAGELKELIKQVKDQFTL